MTETRTRPDTATLRLSAPSAAVASPSQRTIEGLAVPYGPVGHSSAGPITFSRGAITWGESLGRVKLLEQHDPDRVVGFAVALEDREEGLWARFEVPASPEGDRALAMAADGRRDGLSVGVMLTAEVLEELFGKWWDGDDSPTAAAGSLLETSLVTIPAFDDARTAGSAAAAMPAHLTLTASFGGERPAPLRLHRQEKQMTTEATAPAPASAEASQATPPVPPTPAPGPAPSAVAGAALEVREAPVYTFDGRGPSFVRDMWRARFDHDAEASGRVAQFQSMLAEGGRQTALLVQAAAPEAMVTAAVETRATEGTGISTDWYRPDLMVAAIDKGRPLVSRIGTVRIDNATPFRVPVEGEFDGVGDHTEGTAHVAEGTLSLSDEVVTPTAVSGAYRLSRELIDAYNPAIDQIALRAMLRDYRRHTEGKVVAALEAADASPSLSVDTVAELRAALNAYQDLDDLPADLVAASTGFYSTLLEETDTTGRPMLPFVGPTNAVGTANAGYTGASVDGVEVVKVSSLTGTTADQAFILRAEHVFIGESPVQTFRFEEVEGPGVVKLALWAYFAAAATRPSGIVRLTTAEA